MNIFEIREDENSGDFEIVEVAGIAECVVGYAKTREDAERQVAEIKQNIEN